MKALDLWKDIVGDWPSLNRIRKKDKPAEIDFEGAPDSMTILAGDFGVVEPEPIDDVYVNVTAEDCAIEADSVALLKAPSGDFRLLDGEVYQGKLVNRPIGLFETSIFADTTKLENPPVPGIVFHSGCRTDHPSDTVLRDILENHFDRQKRIELVDSKQIAEWEDARDKHRLLRLCPITRSIISRHLANNKTKARSASFS